MPISFSKGQYFGTLAWDGHLNPRIIPLRRGDERHIPREVFDLYRGGDTSNVNKWVYAGTVTAQKTADDPTLVQLEIHSFCDSSGKTRLKFIDID